MPFEIGSFERTFEKTFAHIQRASEVLDVPVGKVKSVVVETHTYHRPVRGIYNFVVGVGITVFPVAMFGTLDKDQATDIVDTWFNRFSVEVGDNPNLPVTLTAPTQADVLTIEALINAIADHFGIEPAQGEATLADEGTSEAA